MSERMRMLDVDPAAYQAVLGMEKHVLAGDLDHGLLELIKIRASQLNNCAFCLDMHLRDARAAGEDQRRLDVISAWREAPQLFTETERAALAFTEEVTLIHDGGVPDDVWAAAAAVFEPQQMATLLMAVVTINVWNRLAVTTHQQLPDLQ